MTELSFLLDLLLNHKLPKGTKEAITARIKEIEDRQAQPLAYVQRPPRTAQSPSTQRILDEMAQEQGVSHTVIATNPPMIAQTPAAAAALAARQEAISIALSGKEEKGRTRPRKF
jgi:hypothetical protein